MGYNNVPVNGWPQIKKLEELDALAKKIDNMPTFTSTDRAWLDEWESALPGLAQDVSDLETDKANQVQMATVEESTTASQAYSAGDYLVLDGVLYKVTDDIAQDGTIVTEGEGKNVDLATVGGELSGLNSKLTDLTPESISVSDVVVCWKYKLANNFNFIMFVFEKNLQDSDIINGHTIISGLPHARTDIYTTVGTDKGVSIPVVITTTGNLVVHYPSASYSGTYRIDATICYYAMD